MEPASYDFAVRRGDTATLGVVLRSQNMLTQQIAALDLEVDAVIWTSAGVGGDLVRTTLPGGGLTVDPKSGAVTNALSAAQTQALRPGPRSPYTVQAQTASGELTTLLAGFYDFTGAIMVGPLELVSEAGLNLRPVARAFRSRAVVEVIIPVLRTRLEAAIEDVDGLAAVLDGLAAQIASKATPADIAAAIGQLTAGSPAELNTFLEAYNRFITDESAASLTNAAIAGLQTAVAARLVAASNLSDVGDKAAALATLNGLDRRVLVLPGDPGAGDVPAATARVVKNTGTGRISVWVNDGGTMIDLLTFAPAS
ncbi:hypothetical protein [Methylobacterium sp. J-092]|uniref:hypothetical protein n=1 Tax=Methylobacterium sp. J-092 TaxID=2836667 RepID=UPI001FBAA15E|nr:hypothetical protein [Methylobacterium sp. J-092]MCJ2009211.1 hypothetical protein [Methylobacterium sp. J-092]